ncbi:hypothetical protein LY76DRAFT_680506 [Colletotrichum caudatum]|nr:hypothetical protein LY76DRAFT_680506 [Colletotrichum caudatum]
MVYDDCFARQTRISVSVIVKNLFFDYITQPDQPDISRITSTKIVPLSLDDALKHVSHAYRTTKAKSFGFLDKFGTADCLLNCDGYASRQKLSLDAIEQPLAPNEEIVKREERRVFQGKLFIYEDLGKSSSSGSGSCRDVEAILDAVPSHHYGKLLLPSTAIRWTARDSGTLELTAPDDKVYYYLRLLSLAGPVNVFRRFPITNALAGDTSSAVSFRSLRNWLDVCEAGHKNAGKAPKTKLPTRLMDKYLAPLNNRKSPTAITTKTGEKIEPYERWHLMVSEHTCLNLTNTSDMLPALSGWAHETAELVDDTFLVGLWQNNLRQDLMWRFDEVAE